MTLEHIFEAVPTTPRLTAEQLAHAEASRESCAVVAHVTGLHGLVAALGDTKEALSTEMFTLADSSWTLAVQQIDVVGLTADFSGEAHISRGAIAVDCESRLYYLPSLLAV